MSLNSTLISPSAYAFLFMITLLPSTSFAQDAQYEGVATIPYDSKRIDPDSFAKLMLLAKEDAITRYTDEFSPSKMKLYQGISGNVQENIDQYEAQPTIIDSGYRKDQHQYYLVIRTTINSTKLDIDMSSGSSLANISSQSQKISISFLFVSRSTTAVKQFGDRVTSVAIGSTDQTDKQSEALSGGTAAVSTSESGQSETVTGGNTVKQADQLTYVISSPEDMNASMSQVFTDKGFEVYDYSDVSEQCGGVKPEDAYQAFSNGDQLPREIRKAAFDAARKCGVNTFATGTLDVGLQDVDPVTGNIRVFVSVRTQVNDLSTPLPRLLASVGPVQYSGLGPNAEVARRNALTNAATEAAEEISDQLKAKGLN